MEGVQGVQVAGEEPDRGALGFDESTSTYAQHMRVKAVGPAHGC
jgi:hypothetical protein